MSHSANTGEAHRNTFLATLPERERERITAFGEIVAVIPGQVLHESGRTIREVWFPTDCVATLGTSMQDGAEAEVAIIGHEGLVGVIALLGGTDTTSNEAAIQIGGGALCVPIERLREETDRSSALRLLLQRYAQALLAQASQTAACNRFHSIEQRLARCLLALHDRVSRDEILITHERLASVLGSFRPSVTLAAQRLQDHDIVRYARGRIEIVDRARLAEISCECYAAVASEYHRLLGSELVEQLSGMNNIPGETVREVNSRLMVAAIREQQARERAEEANEVTTRFFATLSHELRTPLTAILGWSDVLQQSQELDDETLHLAIDTIRRNAETQKRLVNDMIDLTRLRAGKVSLRLEPVDVAGAVRAAIASSRPSADQSSIAISFIAGEPATANADPVRLDQIFSNLLSNAVKFTLPGGSIEVAMVARPSDVEISVRDSGCGITADLLPHVFDQFRQGPTASGELGMGLGLAIVHQLVTLHGGTVDVQSAGPGSGATFTVVLPRG